MAMRAGRALMPFGVMGGDYQPFGHCTSADQYSRLAMDPQSALDSARVFYDDGAVEAEREFPRVPSPDCGQGHRIVVPVEPHGGGQAILIDWKAGTLTAGSDPRKDGCALGCESFDSAR